MGILDVSWVSSNLGDLGEALCQSQVNRSLHGHPNYVLFEYCGPLESALG